MTNTKDNKKWFAIYVKSRNEKKVFKQLDDMGIESFLPLITRLKQWSDRRKKVEEPLFRSYLFIHHDLRDPEEYYKILNIPGVVRFVTIEKKPVSVPKNQIIAIKEYLNDTELQNFDYDDFKEGELVRIKSGQMKDLIGRYVETKGKHHIIMIIEIETVGQSLPITVPRSMVEAVRISQ